jgi:hypothetical protein
MVLYIFGHVMLMGLAYTAGKSRHDSLMLPLTSSSKPGIPLHKSRQRRTRFPAVADNSVHGHRRSQSSILDVAGFSLVAKTPRHWHFAKDIFNRMANLVGLLSYHE